MTVSSTTNRKAFTGDGSTTAFGTSPVVFFVAADLEVYLVTTATGASTLQTLTTHYTVSGGDGSTGTVTMVTAPTAAQTLVIVRNVSATQEYDPQQNDGSDAEALEDAFDKLTMIAQQNANAVDRVLRQPDSDTTGISALPNVVDRASKYLGFDSSGNPIAAAAPSSSVTSTFMATVLDDTTAAAARTTLGAYGGTVGSTGTVLSSDGTQTPVWSSVAGFTTGDVKITLKTTADSGWVMMNDGTIGSASSGATTRANADTSDLFTLLWNNTADAQCAVSTGRGASAAADFAANKTIALPKVLGRALAVSGAGSGLTSRALALALGDENLASHTHTGPSHTHTGTTASNGAHTHDVEWRQEAAGSTHGLAGDLTTANNTVSGTVAGAATSNGAHTHTFTTDAGGTGATGSTGTGSAGNMQPSAFLNVMIKL